MDVIFEVRSPGMKDSEYSNFSYQSPLGKAAQHHSSTAEQQILKQILIRPNQIQELMRQREDHMQMWHLQDALQRFLKPLLPSSMATSGTIAIPA